MFVWLLSFPAFAQGPPLLREAFTREYSIHVGGEQTPLVKEIASREVSIFIGAEPASPYAQAISREMSIAVTTPAIPDRVTQLTVAVSPTGDRAILEWCGYNEIAQSDIVRYRIYVATTPFTTVSNLAPYTIVPAGICALTITNLTPFQDHYFAVVAEDALGGFDPTVDYSAAYVLAPQAISREYSLFVGAEPAQPYAQTFSREMSVLITTPAVPDRVTPLAISVSPLGDTATLNWNAYNEIAQSDVVRYDIYVSTNPFGSVSGLTVITNVPAGTSMLTISNLPPFQDHYFAVVAVDGLGGYDSAVNYSAAYVLAPQAISRDYSLFVGSEPAPPYSQVVSREVSILVPDAAVPDAVTGLGSGFDAVMSVSAFSAIDVNWSSYNEVKQNDVVRYRIYVGLSFFADVSAMQPFEYVTAGALRHTISGLAGGNIYYVAVVAEDALGNWNPTVRSVSAKASSQPGCLEPPAGLVGWWPGDGNANDIIGGNHGILQNGATFATGEVGLASWPNGSFVRVPNAASLEPAQVTAMAWVQATNVGGYAYILSKSLSRSYSSYALFSGSGGGLLFYFSQLGTISYSPDAGPQIWDGNFHHVAGTYDGATLRLYIDGHQIGNGAAVAGSIAYGTGFQNGDLLIGACCPGETDGEWPGLVDEAAIFNRALTANEIAAVYSAGSAGMCKPPPGTPVVLVNGRFHPDNAAIETNSALIQIQSSFSGRIYYTLNGAPPASGVLYNAPFVLTQPALVRVVVLNANFAPVVEADPIEVDVVIPPYIITPPQGRIVGAGADVDLEVVAGGTTPLSYQWLQDGLPVPGAVGPALALEDIQPNQGGNYTVIITNLYGSITSAPAPVIVFAPPTISAQPGSLTVSVGDSATFFISALGPPPLEYQWRKNGANIADTTNRIFTIPSVQFDDGASYTVVVGSPGGTVVSDPALLIIAVPSPPGGDNFASTNTLLGASGAASGTNNFATREPGEPLHAGKPGSNSVWYTWTAPAGGIATFRTSGSTFDTLLAVYTGNNVASLTTVVSDEDSGGFLASQVSFNAIGNMTYHIAIDGLNGGQGAFLLRWDLVVTATVVPEIICPPASLTVQPGQNATFTVSVSGPALAYQWRFNGVDISSATQASYTRANVRPEDVGFYSVRVRSTAALSVESAPAILEIGPDPSVQSKDKPDDVAAICQSAPRFRAQANAAGASSVAMGSIGYQVLVSSSTNNLIDCNTTNCGGIPVGTRYLELQPSASGTFVLDTGGSASRTKVWVCRGGTNNLDRTRSYLTCDVDSAPDGRSLVEFSAEAGRSYQVWVSRLDDTNGVLQLNWKLGLPPRIVSLSPNLFAPAGGSLILSIAATNMIDAGVTHPLRQPVYAWYFNGTELVASGPSLTLTGLKASDAGQYVVVAKNEVGATSAVVRVEVFGAANRALVTAGGFTELFADATTLGCGGAAARYQWHLNGVVITGETNRNLLLRRTQPAQAGQYSVTVSNCFGTVTYPAATVAVTVDVGFNVQWLGNGQVVLRWQTTPGKHYRVEHRPSLDSATWTPLPPDLSATSSSLMVVDSIGSVPRFYRIVLLD